MNVFEIIGWISVAAWAYVALAMAAYRVLYYLAYPFERVQLALLWPVALQILIVRRALRWDRARRARRRFPSARVNRGNGEDS